MRSLPIALLRTLGRAARKFGVGRSVGMALLCVLVGLRVFDPRPLEELRLRTFDFYQVLAPRNEVQRPAVIIDIDEASLRAHGQWPWPRTLLADLVAKLTRLGVAAIAFDVIFAEPDRMSPAAVAENLNGLDQDARDKLRGLPDNDQVLADAIRRSRVVLGQSGAPAAVPPPEVKLPVTGMGLIGGDPSPHLVTYAGLLRNVPPLELAAAGRGLISLRYETDGVVRRVPMVMKAQGMIAPALTLELLRVVTGAGAVLVKTDAAGVRSVAVPGLELPTDGNGQLWIRFGRHDAERYVSAVDVLEGRVDPSRIARKVALVGTSAIAMNDLRPTPVDGAMPGVEIHAQILESALGKSILSRPGKMIGVELVVGVLVSVAIIGFAPILGALTLLASGGIVAAALIGSSWYLFTARSELLDVTFPLLCSLSIYGCLVFINYVHEQNQRRRIRSQFSQYLAPALVERLAQAPEELALGGVERIMTIMFSDVRGFTAISELYKDDPHGLTTLMNRFLTPLTDVIMDRSGTIDKYMGDAIMAFWNAPLDVPSQEFDACDAALEMIDRVEQLNREREEEARVAGQPFLPIRIGVGLNTGRCVVGNFGSDRKFNYSVMGDAVNLASRLEGQTKYYGVPIIIGSKTAERASGKYATLELDLIRVKGKREPEAIHAVLGREDVLSDAWFQDLRDRHARMLRCYRGRDWDGALAALAVCRASEQKLALKHFFDLYATRIQAFQQSAPPDEWAGVFVAETK